MRFGEFLLAHQLLEASKLEEALDTQRYRPMKLGRILKELGNLSEATLNRELSMFLGASEPISSLEALRAQVQKSALEPRFLDFSHEHGVAVVRDEGRKLRIFSESFQDEVLEHAEKRFQTSCELQVVDADVLRFLRSGVLQADDEAGKLHIEERLSDEKKIQAFDPYTSFFRSMLLQAQAMRASDIHIEPVREGVSLRFRVDGELLPWRTLELWHRRPFIQALKRLLNLDIAISGVGQDARVSLRPWGLDLRVNLGNTQYGEKITLRLLRLDQRFELSAMGFDEDTKQALSESLKLSHGVILVSGPTGSGKTTTLYSLLCELDRKALNIMTLEDPIEYSIDGLIQVPISKKFGFSDALRTALRQDPDVILVGEIRDAETADLCVKAASTGHLVLSTVHANGAAEVVDRLLGLGVEKHLLRSVLRFSSAQRLLQKLCRHCAIPGKDQASVRTRNPEGCDQCRSGVPGILGRVPILEYMREAEIAEYLELSERGSRRGLTLCDAARRRVEKGEVDEESTRAIA